MTKKNISTAMASFIEEMKPSASEILYFKSILKKYRYYFICLILLIVFNLTYRLASAIYLRVHQHRAHEQTVFITHPRHVPLLQEYVLPGTLTAWHEAPIYARINGYLKEWYVDMGDYLKKGQLMALIEAPELEAQYHQAESYYHALQAQHHIAKITAHRWSALVKEKAVSYQEADEKINAAKKIYADMLAAKAQMKQLQTLYSFREIRAPFDGHVSLRNVDIGNLVNAGSQTNAGLPLFKLVQRDNLRLQLKIPQAYIKKVDANISLNFEFEQFPGQVFKGKLLHVAAAIDPLTRTLLAEFAVENKHKLLLPGIYAHVHYKIPSENSSVRIPVNALLFRTEGLQVAIVDKNSKIILKDVSIYRDFGDEVEINYGLNVNDRLVLNPYDDIENGQTVKVHA